MTVPELDDEFAAALVARKADFVVPPSPHRGLRLVQHGARAVPGHGTRPVWPPGLDTHLDGPDPIIETFVVPAGGGTPIATGNHEPFAGAWLSLTRWMTDSVATALESRDMRLVGECFVTCSLTSTDDLEGLPHLDDAVYLPDAPVGIVAILGQFAGPRVALGEIEPLGLRELSHVEVPHGTRSAFTAGDLDHCVADADELVVFPQFGQLHAGPSAADIVADSTHRQLLVLRATAAPIPDI